MNDQIKCASCGKFIAAKDLGASRFEHTPLSDLSIEENEWTCPPCLAAERQRRVCRG